MGQITEIQRNSNQLHVGYDVSQIALGNNEFIKGDFTSAGGETLAEGTVMGRISATGKLAVLSYDASDGSQYPVGVLYNGTNGSITLAASETKTLTLINKGRIDVSKLAFASDTTINSVITDQRLVDRLANIGLVLESITELSALDNQ